MNALKLADDLNNANGFQYIAQLGLASQAATMLRQQQAEIEALKANRKHDFGLGEASGFIKGHKENPYQSITNTKIEPTVVSYTHPVKELSRMDVYELAIESGFMLSTQYGEAEHKLMPVSDGDTLVKLARAILRKAQEK